MLLFRSLRRLVGHVGLVALLAATGCRLEAPAPSDAGLDARAPDAPRADGSPGDSAGPLDAPPADAPPADAPPPDALGDGGVPVATPRPVVYQLVVRTFGNTDETRARDGTLAENGVGRFSDIDAAALGEIRALGATHVWLTGVLRQATLTDWSSVDPALSADDPDIVKGRAGSFYAVRDYYDVSPDYADDPARRLEEFDALVARIHAAGMRVVIDLVPNHVARSYGSVVHPERDFGVGDDTSAFFAPDNSFFYVGGSGASLTLSHPSGWAPSGVVFDGVFPPEDGSSAARRPRATGNNVTSTAPSASDWYETVKLNWGLDFSTGTGDYDPRPSTWTRMDEILAYWQARGVDGFRCDFAHYVPDEAWSWLLAEARARDADALFFAEAYERLPGLLAAGFDAVYHDAAYDTLKAMYLGRTGQGALDALFRDLGDRDRYLHYLENHDERRLASPIVTTGGTDDSGFGGPGAGRQLAPLLYLYSAGPVLFYAGQEVGEAGAGVEGFGGDDGRTSIFDYWSMPALVRWVNGGAYDGGASTPAERDLRAWYADLLALAQDPSVRGSGYWGLEYVNNTATHSDCPDALFSYARYAPGSGRLVLVVANFAPGVATTGRIRITGDLAAAAGLSSTALLTVRRVLDETGAVSATAGAGSRADLVSSGFAVNVADQASHVFVVE